MSWLVYIFLWMSFYNTPIEDRLEMYSTEQMAMMCGLDEDEFEYFAQVVEAEADGRTCFHEGKTYVAATIWCRVNSESWPNTPREVLDQSGQFTTTYRGVCRKAATPASRYAVLEAYYQLQSGDIPTNIIYFNCIGYNNGTAYGKIGDNYFMQSGPETAFGWNDDMYVTTFVDLNSDVIFGTNIFFDREEN